MALHAPHFLPSPLRRFLESESAAGLLLMVSAAAALLVANSAAAAGYRATLGWHLGPLSLLAWINDAGMAMFFLLVGLEIKREVLHGQLRSWPDRALPGLAAVGGMIVPASIFAAVNAGQPSLRGWAIPAATDIAFVLGVVALLGRRVPTELKLFLTALAVLDDLGAVVIIAVFYTGSIVWPMLGLAAGVVAALSALNRFGVRALWPYLVLGLVLWPCVFASGVHATVAGVLLALTIPAGPRGRGSSPLERLEIGLSGWVAFLLLPLFGFANAGLSLAGIGPGDLLKPVPLGVGLGLFLGKQAGIVASTALGIRLGIVRRPPGVTWTQFYGAALLCGVGFTMSLFIGLLAFAHSLDSLDDTKVGVFVGSLLSAGGGALVLRFARSPPRRTSRLRE